MVTCFLACALTLAEPATATTPEPKPRAVERTFFAALATMAVVDVPVLAADWAIFVHPPSTNRVDDMSALGVILVAVPVTGLLSLVGSGLASDLGARAGGSKRDRLLPFLAGFGFDLLVMVAAGFTFAWLDPRAVLIGGAVLHVFGTAAIETAVSWGLSQDTAIYRP